jgi:hypothetical protein
MAVCRLAGCSTAADDAAAKKQVPYAQPMAYGSAQAAADPATQLEQQASLPATCACTLCMLLLICMMLQVPDSSRGSAEAFRQRGLPADCALEAGRHTLCPCHGKIAVPALMCCVQ